VVFQFFRYEAGEPDVSMRRSRQGVVKEVVHVRRNPTGWEKFCVNCLRGSHLQVGPPGSSLRGAQYLQPFYWAINKSSDATLALDVETNKRVGLLDEAFVPTGWDEADLAFRIREAGWKVAVHGYERLGAFKHLGSTTFTKYSLNLERDLNNGRLFYGRWDDAIRRGSARARRRWRRPMTAGAWMHTLRMIGNYAVPSRRQAILNGEW